MKTRKTQLISANKALTTLSTVSKTTSKPFATLLVLCALSACTPTSNIVPQLASGGSANSKPIAGADIAQANALLSAGKQRDAAAAYFAASQNYRSPERERLTLQAAELASLFNDPLLTQRYLAQLSFDPLSIENKTRFRLTQAHLALNDKNYRETLRILPQGVNNIPQALGQKVLNMRITAAQGSGDKLALVQELVLQEANLTEPYQVKLNHQYIWSHAKQIQAFQLEHAKNNVDHPIVNNWLSLAQLARINENGPASKRETLHDDLGRWIQSNTNHPAMGRALGLLNATPATTVTPYSADSKPTQDLLESATSIQY